MQGGVRAGSSRLYEVLGVTVQASTSEIKTGFRRMATTFHPDKNKDPGAADRFKEITLAYEVLSDSERRELYDVAGEVSLHEGFDANFWMGRKRGKRKGEDLLHALDVALEDLYCGKTVHLQQNRRLICGICMGKGSAPSGLPPAPCRTCHGARFTVSVQQLAPGMMQHVQATCRACNGTGLSDVCPQCQGGRVVAQTRQLSVPVARGMTHNQRIVLSGEADEAPDVATGDVIIVLNQRPHPRFRREGDDLHISQEISLREALVGYLLRIPHLDGRVLVVKPAVGDVVSPGALRCVESEGMPEQSNPLLRRGKLFIHFSVTFPLPHSLSTTSLAALASLLPATPAAAPFPSITTSVSSISGSSDPNNVPNEEEVVAVQLPEPQTSRTNGGSKQANDGEEVSVGECRQS